MRMEAGEPPIEVLVVQPPWHTAALGVAESSRPLLTSPPECLPVGYGSESGVNQGARMGRSNRRMDNTHDACMHVHTHAEATHTCTRHAPRNFQEFQKLKTQGSFSLLSARVRPTPP